MKIKSIRLQRFRQFNDTTINFRDFNLLVGPNNSGKTTILHAIRAFFLMMNGHLRFEGDPKVAQYHRRYLTGTDEIAPTPDIKELWHRQQAGKPITVSITFEDNQTIDMSLKQQFGQIHISSDNIPAEMTESQAAKYFGTSVAFIPGLVGVLVTEPYATRARRNSLATQGRYSEIFRSSLRQLKEMDSQLVVQINEWLKDLFEVEVSSIGFDETSDEYVTVKYRQAEVEYDVVCSGAGLQQIIQMLTYLYLSKPKILLIDEPDAHLHSRLQARLGDLFRRVANDLRAQVFLSTHSIDLIDTFSTEQVLVVDSTKREIFAIGHNADLVSTLVDADIVDVSALSRLLSSKRLVVIEDADQTVLKAIDKCLGSPLFSVKSSAYVLPAKGTGNFRAIRDLGNVLKNMTGTNFDVTFVQDRDGMPDFSVKAYLESQSDQGFRPVILDRHEIESYLIEPRLFEKATKKSSKIITKEAAENAIIAAGKNLSAEARRMSRETAKSINRFLTVKEKESNLENDTDRWFDRLQIDTLACCQEVIPGKELLAETIRVLNQGREKDEQITRGQLVAALEECFIDNRLVKQIRDLASGVSSLSSSGKKSTNHSAASKGKRRSGKLKLK